MTDVDVTKLEVAEDTLERMMHPLERAAFLAYSLAADSDDDDDDEPGPQATLSTMLNDCVDELRDALDCVQMALGRPYVWLLSRSS
jgi:hypothetical protein